MNRTFATAAAAALAACVLASPAPARADTAVGLVLGSPSGLSIRGQVGDRLHLQSHIGFGFFPGDGVTATLDVLGDLVDFTPGSDVGLMLYLGGGPKLEWFTGRYYAYASGPHDTSHFGLGVRGVIGLRAQWRNAPWEIFFELQPIGFMISMPDTAAWYDTGGGLGFRYRF